VVGIVLTILKSSDGSRKLPLDTSLKITKISRTPISDDDLKQQKKFFSAPGSIPSMLVIVILTFVYIIITIILIYKITSPLSIFNNIPLINTIFRIPILMFFIRVSDYISFVLLALIVFQLVTAFVAHRKRILSLGQTCEDSRFYLFKKAEIEVEAPYEILVSKCQEALKNSGVQVIEIRSEEASRITTVQGSIVNSFFDPSGILKVQIDRPDEQNKDFFHLETTFQSFQKPPKESKEPLENISLGQYRSRLINRFIRRFVTSQNSSNAKQ